MEPRAAVLEVLKGAEEPLHWTVIQDRALREGLIDPFTVPDVRAAVLRALHELRKAGAATSPATGVWALTAPT